MFPGASVEEELELIFKVSQVCAKEHWRKWGSEEFFS